MRLDSTDFELFGLPSRFAVQRAELDACWKALQGQVHPDRFAAQGASAQRLSMQWSVRVNEAYRRLKDPLSRAAYLCELRGVKIDSQSNTGMPADFLVQQMAWREALEDAVSPDAVSELADEVARQKAERLTLIETLLDHSNDAAGAAAQVRALMFIQRFSMDVEERLQGLGQ
jgi:molecular chaperone HscB